MPSFLLGSSLLFECYRDSSSAHFLLTVLQSQALSRQKVFQGGLLKLEMQYRGVTFQVCNGKSISWN